MRILRSAANDGEHGRRTFLIPSIPDLVFAGLAWLQVAAASVMLLNRDGDLPRHIAVGKVMLEPRFSPARLFLAHGVRPAIPGLRVAQSTDLRGDLRVGRFGRGCGVDGCHHRVGICGADWLSDPTGVAVDLVLLTIAAAALLGITNWAARPHAFSFAASAILLRLLDPDRPARLLWFVPLFALWANLHPGFLFGLGVLGLVTIGDLGEAITNEDGRAWWRAARYHGAALGIGSAATLLNPHGVGLHMHSLGHLGNSEIIPGVVEFTHRISIPSEVWRSSALCSSSQQSAHASRACRRRCSSCWQPWRSRSILNVTLRCLESSLPLIALGSGGLGETPRVLREPGRTLASGDRLARRGAFALAGRAARFAVVKARVGTIATDFSAEVFPANAVRFARMAGVTVLCSTTTSGAVILRWLRG